MNLDQCNHGIKCKTLEFCNKKTKRKRAKKERRRRNIAAGMMTGKQMRAAFRGTLFMPRFSEIDQELKDQVAKRMEDEKQERIDKSLTVEEATEIAHRNARYYRKDPEDVPKRDPYAIKFLSHEDGRWDHG